VSKPTEPGITLSIDDQDFHLGYSRISKYLDCPKQFKYCYIDGMRVEGKMHMRKGNAYHDCLEQMLLFKIKKNKLASLTKCEALAQFCGEKWRLTECETNKVIEAVRYYHNHKYVEHKPLVVEEAFEVFRGGVKITGRIDLIETDGWITDHKFSNDIWAEARAKHGPQPIVYQWAGNDYVSPKYGVGYKGFRYNVMRLWPFPVIQAIEIEPVSQAKSDWWEEQIAAIATNIRSGAFPARPDEKTCKWCDYKKECGPCIYDVHMPEIKDDIDEFNDCD
jgi:RecB family exonuclease